MAKESFEWDTEKARENLKKHGVSFAEAQFVFADPNRVIAKDLVHSTSHEDRYYCFGRVDDGIMTVRFTYRRKRIRIYGAGFWRKGRRIYERETKIHR